MGDLSEMDNCHDHDEADADTHTNGADDGSTQTEEQQKGEEEKEDEEEEEGEGILLNSLDDVSGVVVGAVLKKTLGDMENVEPALMEKDPRVLSCFPDHKCVEWMDVYVS